MVRKLLIFIAALIALCGCQHKDLCYLHPHTIPIRVNVDWEQFRQKEEPTGMTVMAFPQNGGEPVTVLSNTLTHTDLYLSAGFYNSIVFNQSVTEFGTLEFRNMDKYKEAEVTVGPAPTKWYTTRADDERTAYEPEWFGTSTVEGTEVTEEMIEDIGHIHHMGVRGNYAVDLIYHTPENVVYTVKVFVHLKNIYNLRSARAALSGMSEGYKFSEGKASSQKVTHLLEEWKLVQDIQDPTKGYIETTLQCFGLPAGHTAAAEENILYLELLLVDNKTIIDCPMEAGNKFVKIGDHNQLELHLILEIENPLPDVKPESGSSGGFDATVEDWGDEIEHQITI